MRSTFLQHHLIAAVGGLIFALYCGLVSIALLPFPPYVIFYAPLWALLFYSIPTVIGIRLARRVAQRLGPYDLFTILAGILALAVSFGFDFAASIGFWLTSRGELHGQILGSGPPPEAIDGWLLYAGSLAAWIALMIGCGLAWKRKRDVPEHETIFIAARRAKIMTWLWLDSVVIIAVLLAILVPYTMQRYAWSRPEKVFERAAAVLQESGTSPGDRALALDTVSRFRTPESIDLLRRAVKEETGATQLRAAVALIGFDDMLALSVLEDPLLHGTPVNGTVQPTTSHTPSDGNGVRVAGFGSIGPAINGRALQQVKDPAAVPILVRLMASPDANTRQGAAGALRGIMQLKYRGMDRWQRSWPDSIDLSSVTDAMIKGLDDPDETVRYFSVCTLMEINLNPHYPATFLFKDNEQAYLNGWKSWAKQREAP